MLGVQLALRRELREVIGLFQACVNAPGAPAAGLAASDSGEVVPGMGVQGLLGSSPTTG